MPTVLITGLNGYTAPHTAALFLKNGWHVRGTVRTTEKAQKVKELPVFAEAVQNGTLQTFVVDSLAKGDFSQALAGVDAIAHIASPWHFAGGSWAEYRDPAVKGTVNLLEQAAQVPSVKAVAILSAFGAVGNLTIPAQQQSGVVYNEESWFPLTEDQIAAATGDSKTVTWYAGSKKLAELAARETKAKLNAQYSLGTVAPPFIFGPPIHFAKASAQDLANADVTTSILSSALAAGKDAPIPDTGIPIYADSRNVAQALYRIIETRSEGRFPLCNGVFDFQELANRTHELYPELSDCGIIPVGEPNNLVSKKGTYVLDGSKAVKELGVDYIPKDQTIRDVIDHYITLGAINV